MSEVTWTSKESRTNHNRDMEECVWHAEDTLRFSWYSLVLFWQWMDKCSNPRLRKAMYQGLRPLEIWAWVTPTRLAMQTRCASQGERESRIDSRGRRKWFRCDSKNNYSNKSYSLSHQLSSSKFLPGEEALEPRRCCSHKCIKKSERNKRQAAVKAAMCCPDFP